MTMTLRASRAQRPGRYPTGAFASGRARQICPDRRAADHVRVICVAGLRTGPRTESSHAVCLCIAYETCCRLRSHWSKNGAIACTRVRTPTHRAY